MPSKTFVHPTAAARSQSLSRCPAPTRAVASSTRAFTVMGVTTKFSLAALSPRGIAMAEIPARAGWGGFQLLRSPLSFRDDRGLPRPALGCCL